MEGLENGYDDYAPVRSAPNGVHNDSSELDNDADALAEAERKAEKRRRKEARAAKRARKESKRLEREQGLVAVESAVDTVNDKEKEKEGEQEDQVVNVEEKLVPTTPKRTYGKKVKSQEESLKSKEKMSDTAGLVIANGLPLSPESLVDGLATPPPVGNEGESTTDKNAGSSKAKEKKTKRKAQDGETTSAGEKPAKKKRKSHVEADVEIPICSSQANSSEAVPNRTSSSAAGPSQSRQPDRPASAADSSSIDKLPQSSLTTNEFQANSKRKRQSNAAASQDDASKAEAKKETDEELRRKFKDESVMHAWLSDQWRDLKEVARLERLGILRVKRGKFSDAEKTAIKEHFDIFKKVNRLDDQDLVDIIMAKGRASKRQEFGRFWPEVAAVAPGRPVKAVKDFVKREFDPRGYKGAWTPEEDAELLRAFNVRPNEWTYIANIVDRTESDCRDRYRNELSGKDTRVTGHWEISEERKLVKAIKELNEQLGNDPLGYEAPWDLVSDALDNKRSRAQCRKKWQDQLRMVELSKGERSTFQNSDRGILIQRLKRLKVQSESEIDWQALCSGYWSGLPFVSLRGAFWRMKKEIPDQQGLAFEDLLGALEKKYPVKEGAENKERKKRLSQLHLVDSDGEGDDEVQGEEEYESEEVERGL